MSQKSRLCRYLLSYERSPAGAGRQTPLGTQGGAQSAFHVQRGEDAIRASCRTTGWQDTQFIKLTVGTHKVEDCAWAYVRNVSDKSIKNVSQWC